MAGIIATMLSKNTTDTLKDMGVSVRGDLSPENALTVETCDMHGLFGRGDKVRVWNSVLRKTLPGMDDTKNAIADGTVIDVTRRLVTVRYNETGWAECFTITDYLGKRVYPAF